jgi:hypothetical protein
MTDDEKQEMIYDMDEIDFELKVLTDVSELTKELISYKMSVLVSTFETIASLLHPGDEQAKMAYVEKYKRISAKAALKGVKEACEELHKS